MKVCIIGFDSLDYYLIEKYDLAHLKQKEYGKVEIIGLESTPIIWTSFITGLPPEEHGVLGWKWENPILDSPKIWGVRERLDRIIMRSKFLTQLVMKVIDRSIIKAKYVPNIKGQIPTIFDYAQHPVDIDVPCYSQDAYEQQRREVIYALGNPIAEKRISDKAWRAFREKRERVLDALSNSWDLFMVHFYLPDTVQHLLWYRENEIERLYREMNNTALIIKKSVGENTFILFISDHGQKRGLHTSNAFYSCNQRLNLYKPRITDFAGIIQQKLGAPSRSDIDKIKKRLQDLGYV